MQQSAAWTDRDRLLTRYPESSLLLAGERPHTNCRAVTGESKPYPTTDPGQPRAHALAVHTEQSQNLFNLYLSHNLHNQLHNTRELIPIFQELNVEKLSPHMGHLHQKWHHKAYPLHLQWGSTRRRTRQHIVGTVNINTSRPLGSSPASVYNLRALEVCMTLRNTCQNHYWSCSASFSSAPQANRSHCGPQKNSPPWNQHHVESEFANDSKM